MDEVGQRLFAALLEEYDRDLAVEIPATHRLESQLGGALTAWREGVERERQLVLEALWEPRWSTVTPHTLQAMVARVHADAERYRALFEVSAVKGRRLGFIARAEVASRFARQLRELLEKLGAVH